MKGEMRTQRERLWQGMAERGVWKESRVTPVPPDPVHRTPRPCTSCLRSLYIVGKINSRSGSHVGTPTRPKGTWSFLWDSNPDSWTPPTKTELGSKPFNRTLLHQPIMQPAY
ncbi:unnamed protein product [Arctogadus glacialis]